MKKFLVGALMFFVVAIMLPVSTDAQTCRRYNRSRNAGYSNVNYGYNYGRSNRRTYRRSYNRGYQPAYYGSAARTYSSSPGYYYANNTGYYGSSRPSFYRRHRNVINMAIGTGGGALLGGLIGGKKGALIGALAGAGGSALYTYKLRPKQRRYYRY